MHMHARMHAKHKCARIFQMSSAAILKLFLTKNDKTEATFQIAFDKTKLFGFIIFFPFQYGSPQKWPPKFFSTVFGQNLDQIQIKWSQMFAKLSGLAHHGLPRSF